LCTGLENAGYRAVCVHDEQTALKRFIRERPDLILLDLALPGANGLELCRQLRRSCDIPILVLVGRLEEAERLVAFEMCADDFVQCPWNPRQVGARITALLLRAERRAAVDCDVIKAADLDINPTYHQVTIAGKRVDLTRTELQLLTALASEPNRAFTRSELRAVLSCKRGMSERTLDTHIRNLRAKIEADPHHPRYVLTIHGVGYSFQTEPG
jgi:DNA-binding response OmpR family regulator